MSPTHDITLDGVGYTLVPGTYRKRNAPATAAVNPRDVRRVALGPFGGGQRQALYEVSGVGSQVSAEAGWDSLGVAPCYNGQGVEPFPNTALFTDALLDTPSPTQRAHAQLAGSNAFIGIGRRIYKSVSFATGSWAALTAVADCGAGFTISGLAYYQDDLLVMFSTGQDIRKLNTTTNALSVWRSGEKGVVGVGYKGQLIYAPRAANNQDELRLSGTKWNGNAVTHLRYLDSPIVNMALFNGKVAIATKTSLYLMGGQPYPGEADDPAVTADTSKAPAWLGDPEPLMTHGTFAAEDDFIFLCSYRGRLYTWLAGRVAEFDDSQEQGRWLRMGPEGIACRGATVAGDWLVVAITSRYELRHELWGFDGQGWWLLAQRSAGDPAALWPCPLGGAGNRDLLVFRNASSDYDLYRLTWRDATLPTYAAAGTWTSSLIDAGDPTRDKAWRAVGATFSQPANRGKSDSADAVTVALDYSVDGGVNWLPAATLASASAAQRAFTLQSDFPPPGIPASRHLQLRVAWSSVTDWAPVLTAVWAEYETLDNAPQRRRWELTVAAGDRGVARDGQVDEENGRQKIAALWQAWEARTDLLYEDAAGPWDPSLLQASDVAVWLNADAVGGLGDGDAVASWPDLSGNGKDATNAASSERPTLQSLAQSGLPMVRFDGVDDDLAIAGFTLTQPFTIFLVARVNSDDAGWLWLSSTPTLGARLSGASGQDLTITAGANASFSLPDYSDDVCHLLAVVYDGAGSFISWDGVAAAPVNAGGNGLSDSTLFLASQGGTPAAFLAADYGELLIVPGALGGDALARYEGYLAHRWGLTANLPGNHPFKNAPPGAYRVRIEEIDEVIAKPSDTARWGESRVALTLAEV